MTPKSNLAGIFGKWPGDETDAQVEAAMREMGGKRVAELEAENARLKESLATRDAQWRDAIIPGNDDTLSRRLVTTPEGAAEFLKAGRELVQEDAKFTEKAEHDRDRYKRRIKDLQSGNVDFGGYRAGAEAEAFAGDDARSQVSSLTSRLAAAEAERERYRELLDKAYSYIEHNGTCRQSPESKPWKCDCGHDEVSEAIMAALSPAPEQGT